MVKIALVMPAYRHALCMPVVLKSVKAALDRVDGELVIVPDGDQDCMRVAREHDWAHTVDLGVGHNQGAHVAINAGHDYAIDELGAEHIGWVSADNILFENYCEVLSAGLDSGYEYFYTRYRRSTVKWRPDGTREVLSHYDEGLPYDPTRLGSDPASGWLGAAFMYTSDLWKRAGYHRGGGAHDYGWWLRAEEASGFKFGFSDEVTMDYSIHDERVSVRDRRVMANAREYLAEAQERRRKAQG